MAKKKETGTMRSMARNMDKLETAQADQPWYPSMTLGGKTFPELKGATVGDKFTILVECSVKGIHQYGNGETEINLDMEKGDVVEEDKSDEDKS